MEETWKDIKGYEGLYKISSNGRVWGCKYKRLLKPVLHHTGYLNVMLYKNAKGKHFSIHRLVALNFIPTVEGKYCVNHIDENKTNNHLENLEWVDYQENNNHGQHTQRGLITRKTSERWQEGVIARSKKIVGISIENGSKIYFSSMKEAKKDGFDNGNISKCVNGKYKMHKGYKWYLCS